jgi:catechol 2,3-dioxygenase-like lactoylglutathione lyase family enzyme
MQILEVILLSENLKETELFYAGKLGFTIINKKAGTLSFAVGRSVLTFQSTEIKQPIYHFAINIPNNKLNEAVTWASLKADLINISENETIADFSTWNAKSFYFFDNNGNILEFIARKDLDNSSDLPFESTSILSISEIGIVSNRVPELASFLSHKYQIPIFEKQTVSPNFAALGNDQGLLILSGLHRHWFPTQTPADKFPTHIKLLTEDEKVVELLIDESFDLAF